MREKARWEEKKNSGQQEHRLTRSPLSPLAPGGPYGKIQYKVNPHFVLTQNF